jgi:2-hydroxychromene-2-carboxylate isomerase
MAMEAGIVVKERQPGHFPAVHLALFAARHDQGRDLREEAVVRDVLEESGVDADAVFEALADGWPRQAFRKAHEEAVAAHKVFGVPTFAVGDAAVFVRLMTRPHGDPTTARSTIEQVVSLLTGHPELNEFKHTSISR